MVRPRYIFPDTSCFYVGRTYKCQKPGLGSKVLRLKASAYFYLLHEQVLHFKLPKCQFKEYNCSEAPNFFLGAVFVRFRSPLIPPDDCEYISTSIRPPFYFIMLSRRSPIGYSQIFGRRCAHRIRRFSRYSHR